ncbi:hypothetical protein GGTG_10939 [Gaeumannomyces tritici R3-111a-1]|uniref:Uncharacterized protein n=1 Tax=Gaeumannomyces tritici (strain R3-111a-1) TaxID=644352 RepID=J3PBR8_GAET3|nr:hypothetical protein GGTG_10939 [Gaeumannomyces tritici R3-111a-1]EJT71685.1 hypothetical protein GGTG_10939 [Gaeumannomyces tritici R3-111a-1]
MPDSGVFHCRGRHRVSPTSGEEGAESVEGQAFPLSLQLRDQRSLITVIVAEPARNLLTDLHDSSSAGSTIDTKGALRAGTRCHGFSAKLP